MPYTFSSFITAVASALEVDPSDADFVAQQATIIDLAEQQCYRDLDLLAANVTVTGASLTANSRFFTLPVTSGGNAIHILVVDAVNVLDATNTRHPLVPATRDSIDLFWPSDTASAASAIPQSFARINDTQILVGAAPGTAWSVELVATIRPAPLSSTNTSTYLSNYLSDLFFTAAMVAATGVNLKNFGAQSDNPQQAVSWKAEYQNRLASAKPEELRKSFVSAMSGPPTSAKDA